MIGNVSGDDLQAVVVIDMDMGGGDDGIHMPVLDPGEVLSQVADIMIVKQTQYTYGLPAIFHIFLRLYCFCLFFL
jgi:hypothetical protein